MHPDPTFRWKDRDAMRALVEDVGFGMLFAQTPEGPRCAHIPALFLEEDRIGFHLSRHNALTKSLETRPALFVAQGPQAYVSPDWYGLADQVPTWNYATVELEGDVTAMDRDALIALIDDVSAHHEARLAPKPAWTRDKMRDGLFDRMLGGITGYVLHIREWRGTLKLGQNKPVAAREAVASKLAQHGQTGMATLMQASLS